MTKVFDYLFIKIDLNNMQHFFFMIFVDDEVHVKKVRNEASFHSLIMPS